MNNSTKGRSRPQSERSSQGRSKPGASAGSSSGSKNAPGGPAAGPAAREGGGTSGGNRAQDQGRQGAPKRLEKQARRPSPHRGKRQRHPERRSNGVEPQDGGQQGETSGVVGSVKQHPIAAAAIGTGVGLLVVQGARKALAAQSDAGREPGRGTTDDEEATSRGQAAAKLRNGARGPAAADDDDDDDDDEAGSRGGGDRSIREAASTGFERGRQAGMNAWHDHPLAVAAAAIAAGVTLALLLPSTRQEDEWLGSVSDRFAGRVKRAGRELVDQGRDKLGRAVSEGAGAVAEAAEEAGLTPQRLGRKLRRVATSVRDAVVDAVQS